MITVMAEHHKYSALDKAFYTSLVVKALDSALEIIGGVFLLFISPGTINHAVMWLTEHELATDPHDFLANYLRHSSAHLTSSSTLFGAFYLLSHGLVKIVIIVALFKQKIWAYPWMIAILLAFIGYQLYRLSYHFSAGLIVLTVFDVFVIWLTWLEYKKHRALAEAKI